jgi:SAM-dependent methyltransferase
MEYRGHRQVDHIRSERLLVGSGDFFEASRSDNRTRRSQAQSPERSAPISARTSLQAPQSPGLPCRSTTGNPDRAPRQCIRPLVDGRLTMLLRSYYDLRMRGHPAGDHDYEPVTEYVHRRQTDPRIEHMVHAGLEDARSVVNVGAGAGSYEPIDRYVIAIEPSASMRSQRPPGCVPAIDAVAENLPLDDDAVDAAMALVTVHQWSDLETGLRELRRVARDTVVILTFDGEALDRFWLAEYAPELLEAERQRYPSIRYLCSVLGGGVVQDVAIPIDCRDGFTEAFYARPEAFLDPATRRTQSGWSFVPSDAVDRFTTRLSQDLESGAWDCRHGDLREQPSFNGSLRLIISRP